MESGVRVVTGERTQDRRTPGAGVENMDKATLEEWRCGGSTGTTAQGPLGCSWGREVF